MKEKPILFSTPMVKAIIEDRKTQTRRVVKPQPNHFHKYDDGIMRPQIDDKEIKSPCQVGGMLWVRESFCYRANDYGGISEDKFWYRATDPDIMKLDDDEGVAFRKDGCQASPWIPSIHMPKKAARIFLEVTGVFPVENGMSGVWPV